MTWNLDLSITKDCLNTLFSVMQRHRNFIDNTLAYDRNYMDLLDQARKGLCKIAGNSELDIEKSRGWSCEYVESNDFGYNETYVNELRHVLQGQVNILSAVGFGQADNIEADLNHLKQLSQENGAVSFKKLIQALVTLSPYLYSHLGADGRDLEAAMRDIDHDTPASVEDRYFDFFIDFLAPIFIGLSDRPGYGQVHETINAVRNRFLEKIVRPAITLISCGNKSLTRRSLSVYEVPKPFGLFRGSVGKDCSMVSVPFFALSKAARIFWIWKGKDTELAPAGYAFMLDGKQGQLPYLITINGHTLSQSDVQAFVHMMANAFAVNQLQICHTQVLSSVINSEGIRESLMSFSRQAGEYQLPSDWTDWERFNGGANGFFPYYASSQLCNGQVLSIGDGSFILSHDELQPLQLYQPIHDLADFSPFEKSCVGEYALRVRNDQPFRQEICQQLNIQDAHIQSIGKLRDVKRKGFISAEYFIELSELFEFNIRSLLNLDSVTVLMNSLQDLYEQLAPAASDPDWAYVVNKTNYLIKQTLDGRPAESSANNSYISRKLSLPDVYLADYWQENEQYLSFADGSPYYYRIHTYAKHFSSRYNIRNFLGFLKDKPQVVDSITPADSSWQYFFERAYANFSDDAILLDILNRVFVARILQNEFGNDYEFASSLVSYLLIVKQNGIAIWSDAMSDCSDSRTRETLIYLYKQQPIEPLISVLLNNSPGVIVETAKEITGDLHKSL